MKIANINKLKSMVENAMDDSTDARTASENDRNYYDGHQWTSDEIAAMNRRRQPVVVNNQIKPKIDTIIGIEQQGRADPRAFPRNPEDRNAALVASQALQYIEDDCKFDKKRSLVLENMLIEGYGGVEVIVEPKADGTMRICVNRIRWEELVFDQHSREKDFSDAGFLGTYKWMKMDDAMDLYGDFYDGEPEQLEGLLHAALEPTTSGTTYEDRPRNKASKFSWADKKTRRVVVASVYYRRGGVWYLAIFTGSGEIFNDVSPYLDEMGEPTCPIILTTSYIDQDNNRYGMVRDMISMQDEINKRRSKLLHQLNTRQTVGVQGAFESTSDLKRELSDPNGHVEINIEQFEESLSKGIKPFEILNNTDQIQGQFALLEESKNEIEKRGPTPALQGTGPGSASGRAIQAQQRAGLAALAPIYDSLNDWTIRVYEAMWMRARQFWVEPNMWIRVTDKLEAPQFIQVNEVVGVQLVQDPQTGQIVEQPVMENRLAEMDMDIIVTSIPDYVTMEHETFENLSQMAASGVPVPPEMLVMAAPLADKDKLLEAMTANMQAQAQQAESMKQVELARMEHEASMKEREIQLETIKVQAQAEAYRARAARDLANVEKTMAEAGETQVDTAESMLDISRKSLGIQ